MSSSRPQQLTETRTRWSVSPKDVASESLSPVRRCTVAAARRSRSKERSMNPDVVHRTDRTVSLPFQKNGSISQCYSPTSPLSIGAAHSDSRSRSRVSFRADELLQTARNQESKESESIAGNGLHYLQNVHHSQHSRSSSQASQGRQEARREGMHHESRSISLSRHSLVSPEYQSLLLSLKASPKPRSKSNHHVKDISRRHHLQRKVSNSDDDDEIQFLNEYNVQPSSSSTSLKVCEDSSKERNNHHVQSSSSDETGIVNENYANTIQISNSEYDPKSGRCIHHPNVRLRKKNMFGRGWKVLMTACPDCCIDELHRIRSIDQNNNMKKQDQTFGISRRSSDNTAETATLTISEYSRSSIISSTNEAEHDRSKTYCKVNSSSPHETFHVSKMPWIDPFNGQSGKYTGSINYNHVPHGSGSMKYDPNRLHPEAARYGGMEVAVVVVKAGEWKQGQFLGPKQRQ